MSRICCRACGSGLPASGICRDCGEDHRSWFARLGTSPPPLSLQAQALEIRRMYLEIQRQEQSLSQELTRLSQHRAATPSGQAVVDETRARLQKGLQALELTRIELEAAALGVDAVRVQAMLEDLRADLAQPHPSQLPPFPPFERACLAPSHPYLAAYTGKTLSFWSAQQALRPCWTLPAPKGNLRFAGTPLEPYLLAGDQVLRCDDGKCLWRYQGTLLDCWQDTILISTATQCEHRLLSNGQLLQQLPFPAQQGWILPSGILLLGKEGLQLFAEDGRCLGQGRYGNHILLSDDRCTLLAFPMVLSLPTLQAGACLIRAGEVEAYALYSDILVGWGKELLIWRLSQGGLPHRLPLAGPVQAVARVQQILLLLGLNLGISLEKWPPRPVDAFDAAKATARLPLAVPPARFQLSLEKRLDRIHGSVEHKHVFCQDLARFAAGKARHSSPEVQEIADAILRDALVVEAEVLTYQARQLAARMAQRPQAADLAGFEKLLDQLFAPMFVLESLTRPLDDTAARRVRGLLAACAETVLNALGERMSHQALSGEAEDGEIEAALQLLGDVRKAVLARTTGLAWVGVDVLMGRWKQFSKEARALLDVAITTRALGRLARASHAQQGAEASVSMEGLGRSLGDLAAQSAADAEVDALLTGSGLEGRVKEGMERVRKELGKRN